MPECAECKSKQRAEGKHNKTYEIVRCNICGKWLHSFICGGPVHPSLLCQHCVAEENQDNDSDGETICTETESETEDETSLDGFIVSESDSDSESEPDDSQELRNEVNDLRVRLEKMEKRIKRLRRMASKKKL